MKRVKKFRNGNADIYINEETGTRITQTLDDEDMELSFPLAVDVITSTICREGCQYCYAGAGLGGRFADISDDLRFKPGMEVAINVNYPPHPATERFLENLKAQGVYANITVNQKSLRNKWFRDQILDWQEKDLFKAIGISFYRHNQTELLEYQRMFKNPTLHVIIGILTPEEEEYIDKQWFCNVLVLGYKDDGGRGGQYRYEHNEEIEKNINWAKENWRDLFNFAEVVVFDNLAIDQLRLKDEFTDEVWNVIFQGEEGEATMAIDLVNNTFAVASSGYEWHDIGKEFDVEKMFKITRAEARELRNGISGD